ncbi:hypothetical protein GBW32_14920 [Streptomyces tsukubensis]|nr:hypothetical protein GBW32_14920 [Streptomyces tsukubensis]
MTGPAPASSASAQVTTGSRGLATRWCALLFKALGEITNHTKPGLTVRELGDTHSGDGGTKGSAGWGTVAAINHRQ